MRRFENVWLGLLLAIGVLAVMLIYADSQVMGAGISIGDPSLGGSSNLDGATYSSSTYNNSNSCGASFFFNLDSSTHVLGSANWYFQKNTEEPAKWSATCYLYGRTDGSQDIGDYGSWSQSITEDSGQVSESLYYDCYQNSYETHPVLSISGSIGVSPASIDSSSFNYREYVETWSNWENDQVTSWPVPVWRAEYYVYGHFLPTSEVPEPSTFVLMTIGIACAGFGIWRKR